MSFFLYSKKIFFLNILIFLSIIASIVGNFALNLVIIFLIIFFIFLLIRKKIVIEINNVYFSYFILLNLFFIINIIYSYNTILSFFSYLGVIKHIFFSLIFFKVFEHNKKNEKLFFNLLIILIFFFCADVLIQFFFSRNILGYPLQDTHGIRLSGLFDREFVAGSFLSKLLFLIIAYFQENKFNNWKFKYIFIFLINSIILLSGERAAFLVTAFSTIFYIFFENRTKIFKKFILLIIYKIFIISILFLNYSIYKENKNNLLIYKYGFLFGHEFQVTNSPKTNNHLSKSENYSKFQNFLDTRHGAHFLTGIEIFLDNKILGSGLKTFREICSNVKYQNINSLSVNERCNTHPHNIYIEFLSELGILGFIIITIILLYIFIRLLKKKDIAMLAYFFILFIPFQTTGSFFSSFNGFFYYIFFGYFFYRDKTFKIEKVG